MIVLDTTVLVYAVGDEHPLKEPSRGLVEAIAGDRVEATTTVEVVQEFVHVRARRRGRHDAADRGGELLRLLGPLITPGDAELALALRLFEENDRLGMFDAVLAATVMLCGADALVSADRAFATVRGLAHIDPAGPEVRQLIEA
ncbi:MAG: type II toxin-antitoxin system VapC family toxin [Chloroflexota bacterium]|nr:type II toxin-antitoxin system VapC family toxin [Chloroflexota bacterium]